MFLFKNQMKNLQGAEVKLTELQAKYSEIEKQNFELGEKVMRFSNCIYLDEFSMCSFLVL